MYRRFRLEYLENASVTCLVLPEEGCLVVEDQIVPIPNPRLFIDLAYNHILLAVIARVRSHFLAHASVVSWKGHGLVFPAHSAHGKTTLTLELVRRGFLFLSDEIAAFDRQHRLLSPFPRNLWVRPGTLALCGLTFPDQDAPTWSIRHILDIESIKPSSLGEPCSADYLVVLTNPAMGGNELKNPERILHILVARTTPELVRALSDIPGVREVSPVPEARASVLRLSVAREIPVIAQVKGVCLAQGIALLDVSKGGEYLPDFRASPRLVPISNAEGTMELIRAYLGGADSALLGQEHGGHATRLFLEVADLLRETRCYRLYVGNLQKMADLVCDLADVSEVPLPGPGHDMAPR